MEGLRKRRTNGASEHAPVAKSRATSLTHRQKGERVAAPAPTNAGQDLEVYVFGEGSAGELGLGNIPGATEVMSPCLNPSLRGVLTVATGGMHAAALTRDNKVLTWGVNDNKALARNTSWDGGMREVDANGSDSDSESPGLNPREAQPTPIVLGDIPSRASIVQVAAGDSTTFIVTTDGSVYGCGTFRDSSGDSHFLIDPVTNETVREQEFPVRIPNLSNIRSVSVGADFALALDHRGCVFGWGITQHQQLGRRLVGRHQVNPLIPVRLELPSRKHFLSIHAGSNHAFAIDSNGEIWAWGSNNFAQTGLHESFGTDNARVAIQRVTSLSGKDMLMVAAGQHHSVGLTKAGECLVWGRLDSGQLGLDISHLPPDHVQFDDRGKPRVLLQPATLPIPRCVWVAAGPDHNIAITADGQAYSWGFNATYQCGQGIDDDTVPLAKLIRGKSVRDVNLSWAGAGGQYSMLAGFRTGA